MMDCSKNFNEENSEQEQYHAGTDNGLNDDETSTKQDDSNGRQTHTQPQTHVGVDMIIANTNHHLAHYLFLHDIVLVHYFLH
jgi:hypothetical protein